jgi:hypothetical protein
LAPKSEKIDILPSKIDTPLELTKKKLVTYVKSGVEYDTAIENMIGAAVSANFGFLEK